MTNSELEVPIPASLVDRIENRIEGTDFEDVPEYVVFVMREVLSEIESAPETESAENATVSSQDEEEVKERLKDLGYM